MATIEKRGQFWRVKIRRAGLPAQTRTFDNRTQAQQWVACCGVVACGSSSLRITRSASADFDIPAHVRGSTSSWGQRG